MSREVRESATMLTWFCMLWLLLGQQGEESR
jgi:hypothetical protein